MKDPHTIHTINTTRGKDLMIEPLEPQNKAYHKYTQKGTTKIKILKKKN
jgi:hypothetical protein